MFGEEEEEELDVYEESITEINENFKIMKMEDDEVERYKEGVAERNRREPERKLDEETFERQRVFELELEGKMLKE